MVMLIAPQGRAMAQIEASPVSWLTTRSHALIRGDATCGALMPHEDRPAESTPSGFETAPWKQKAHIIRLRVARSRQPTRGQEIGELGRVGMRLISSFGESSAKRCEDDGDVETPIVTATTRSTRPWTFHRRTVPDFKAFDPWGERHADSFCIVDQAEQSSQFSRRTICLKWPSGRRRPLGRA
jgi:hypothetical protein